MKWEVSDVGLLPIIISTQNFPPKAGGIQNYLYELANALQQRGHEVTVFCDSARSAEDDNFDSQRPYPVVRIGGPKLLRRHLKAFRVAAWLRKHTRALLICDTWKSLEKLPPKSLQHATCVCIGHGMEFPQQPAPDKLRRITSVLEKADWILANSSYTAERINPYCSRPDKLQLLHPGAAEPLTATEQQQRQAAQWLQRKSPVLLTIGRLEPRKGQDRILEILPKLLQSYPDLIYLVAGSGPLEDALKERVSTLGLSDSVQFCGRISDGEKSALLQLADVFVMPCRIEGASVEGFGIVYVEAALFGVPAIAGKDGGAVDAVIDGETGLVCDGADDSSILSALETLLGNPLLRQQLGSSAQQRAREQLMWPAVADRLLRICQLKTH